MISLASITRMKIAIVTALREGGLGGPIVFVARKVVVRLEDVEDVISRNDGNEMYRYFDHLKIYFPTSALPTVVEIIKL